MSSQVGCWIWLVDTRRLCCVQSCQHLLRYIGHCQSLTTLLMMIFTWQTFRVCAVVRRLILHLIVAGCGALLSPGDIKFKWKCKFHHSCLLAEGEREKLESSLEADNVSKACCNGWCCWFCRVHTSHQQRVERLKCAPSVRFCDENRKLNSSLFHGQKRSHELPLLHAQFKHAKTNKKSWSSIKNISSCWASRERESSSVCALDGWWVKGSTSIF